MGLTIHYSLKAQGTEAHARKLVQALHQTAHDLPFQELGDIVELSGDECDFHRRDPDDPVRWLLIQAAEHVESKNRRATVQPTRLIAFPAWPGEGCEPSNFGLCQFPAVVETALGPIKTKLSGWHWGSFCKTQYASNPECGGVMNFLRCHLSVVAMLDSAKKLGCLERVSDEGGFWRQRDVKALVQEIGTWNEMVAAVGGCLKDLAGDKVQMAIASFPNFEMLEAAGHQKLAKLIEQVRTPRQPRQSRRRNRA